MVTLGLVMCLVGGLAPAAPARAAPAPLTVRIGLAWDRWAVRCFGSPTRGISASLWGDAAGGSGTSSSTSLWPTSNPPGATPGAGDPVPQPGPADYIVATAGTATGLVATDSRWVASAAKAAAERTSRAMGTRSPLTGALATSRRGPTLYVIMNPQKGTHSGRAAVQALVDAGWPAALLAWPAAPGHPDLDREGLCAVALSGQNAGLVHVASSPISLQQPAGGAPVAHARLPYRGRLEILTAGDARLLSVVNHVDIEDYLLGVVPSEMPSTWPLEALKAQAVAARTYTVSNLGRHAGRGFDLCFDIHCQAYGGIQTERTGPSNAVRQTAGLVATYGGRLINAVYHAHAGGATDSSRVIWGAVEPYLAGTSRTYEQPYYWTAANTRAEVEAAVVRAAGEGPAAPALPLLRMVPREFTAGSRALRVDAFGPEGSARISASSLRSSLGSYRLRSANFRADMVWMAWLWPEWSLHAGLGPAQAVVTWAPGARGEGLIVWQQPTPLDSSTGQAGTLSAAVGWLDPAYFVFSGEGFGHGVGMSQWGAREMAALGFGYRDILTNYYRGITVAGNYGR